MNTGGIEMRLALTVRQALNRAGTEYRLEPIAPLAFKTRKAAEARVPPGGILVKSGNEFIPMAMVKR